MLHRARPEQEASDGETAWKAEKINVEYRFLSLTVVMCSLVVKGRGKHD